MNDADDQLIDLGGPGDRRPDPLDGDASRARRRGAALTATLSIVAVMLAVAVIRVNPVDRSSRGTAAPRNVTPPASLYRHETPNRDERPSLGDVDATVDLRTGEMTPLPGPIVEIAAGEPHYALSPDGTQLAFVGITRTDGYQVIVANLDGTHVRAVTTDASANAAPAWSPDGTEVVYEAARDAVHHLAVVDLTTGRTRSVIRGRETVDERAWAPAFAPDGRTILFTVRNDGDPLDGDLWTVPASGGRPSLLLTNGAFGAYSPDGTSIAYRRARSMLSTWIRIVDAEGHNPVQVGRGVWNWRPVWPFLGTPAWSPDGTRIAFEGDRRHGVVVADVTGGARRDIGSGERPVWLDDHTLIVEAVPS